MTKSRREATGMDELTIRRAVRQDIPGIDRLLSQVLDVHHAGRPDLFRAHTRKYTDEQLLDMLPNDDRPIFVAVRPSAKPGDIAGYAFCIHQQHVGDNVLTDVRTLYIDDLCVDESQRGLHVGTRLYEHVLSYARESGCYNVTLNVWACNESARRFYEHLGLVPQKIGMETIL